MWEMSPQCSMWSTLHGSLYPSTVLEPAACKWALCSVVGPFHYWWAILCIMQCCNEDEVFCLPTLCPLWCWEVLGQHYQIKQALLCRRWIQMTESPRSYTLLPLQKMRDAGLVGKMLIKKWTEYNIRGKKTQNPVYTFFWNPLHHNLHTHPSLTETLQILRGSN